MAIRRQPALSPAARKKESHIHVLFQKLPKSAVFPFCTKPVPGAGAGVTHIISETRGNSVGDLLSAPLKIEETDVQGDRGLCRVAFK